MAHAPRRHRLTVVDNSPEVLALLGDVLRLDGTEVTLLESATLRDIEATDPDLLVIDLRLGTGGLAGLEVVRLVRSRSGLQHLPVVICSADHDQIAQHQDELDRMNDVFTLPKPFSLDQLESCVSAALARTRAPVGRWDDIATRPPLGDMTASDRQAGEAG